MLHHLRSLGGKDGNNAEVFFYVLCATGAAVMIGVDYAAGRPPWFFWILCTLAVIGVVRIFQIAWREDRARNT